MLPVRPSRRDPAPSRLRYRLTRLWLRPWFRRLVNFGVPMLAGVALVWTLAAEFDARARFSDTVAAAKAMIVERPQFTITELDIRDVSADLAEQIRIAAFVKLPANSLEVDVNAVRTRVENLAAVERIPVVVWRSDEGLELLDQGGVRVAEIDSRLRRIDLPLIAGEGASTRVAEALALLAAAKPVAGRVRGLVRMGERRWDLVLDRDQVIRLPATDPGAALDEIMALHESQDLLDRDLTVVDMRDPARPMVRLTEHSVAELARLRAMVGGEDA